MAQSDLPLSPNWTSSQLKVPATKKDKISAHDFIWKKIDRLDFIRKKIGRLDFYMEKDTQTIKILSGKR